VLLKELGKVKHADRVFHFSCQIWFPHRWIVTRHLYGEDEVIPTVLADTPINQTADAEHVPGPDEVLMFTFIIYSYGTGVRLGFILFYICTAAAAAYGHIG